jgi:hypothetical protein
MKGFLKFSAIILLGVGLLGAIYVGLIDPRRVKVQARNALSNVGSAAAGALSSGSPGAGRTNSPAVAEECRQNLRRLESAKRALASRGMFATGSVSWDAVVKELGGRRPACPAGGTYHLGTLQQLPTCSVAGGGTVDSRDDHVIKAY